jgi:hypothetical protein
MRSASIWASASERAEDPPGGGDATCSPGVVACPPFAEDDPGGVADLMENLGLPIYGLADVNCHAVLFFTDGDNDGCGEAGVSDGPLGCD